jgi:RNA polymerase sigma-B factor
VSLTSTRSPDRVRSLFVRYAEDRADREALDELFGYFQPLARRLALRYARGSEPVDDLEQIANLGLLKALRRFEPGRGFAFSSFAVPTILGELKRSFRDSSWVAHVPRSVQERSARVRDVRRALEPGLGRPPSVREIAETMHEPLEDVLEAMRAMDAMSSLSLDAPSREEDEVVLGEQLGGSDPSYEQFEDIAAIRSALPALSGLQREVLELRFAHDLKQSEIATRLGVSQMQISRLLASGLQRLRIIVEHQSEPRALA